MKTVKDYYKKRFPENEFKQRDKIWKVLTHDFLQKYVFKSGVVMDIGAGYCEFINNIKAKKKFAVDINPDTKKMANSDVEVVVALSTKIPKTYDGKIDNVFMSNFLEHLSTKEEVIETLERCYQLLKSGGKVMIMQPNINLTKEKYWDFIDHKVALNTASVVEALEIAGFETEEVIERFLPYTTKSNFSSLSSLLPIYLMIPHEIRPFAGQSFFLAKK